MKPKDTPIAPDLVSLIEKRDPARMATIREAFPDQQDALRSARELGGDASTKPLTKTQRAAYLDVLRTGIPVLAASLDDLSRTLRKRMLRVSNVRFAGTVLAAVSGGLAGVLALRMEQEAKEAVLAFVAMLSALSALFADHYDRVPSGIRIATMDEFSRNLERRGEIEAIRIRVERDGIIPNEDDEIRAMIKSMDDASKRVLELSAI